MSPGAALPVAPWYPADAAALLACAVALILIVARLRRGWPALPAVAGAGAAVAGVALWTATPEDFWLHTLRVATPALLLAAFLLTLRGLPAQYRLSAPTRSHRGLRGSATGEMSPAARKL